MNRIRRFFRDPDVRQHGWKVVAIVALMLVSHEMAYQDEIRTTQDGRGQTRYAGR